MPNLNAMGDFMKKSGKDLFAEEDPSMPPKKKPMGAGMPAPDEPMGDAAPAVEDEFKDLFGKGGDYEPPNQEPGHEGNETAVAESLEIALGKEVSPDKIARIMAILNEVDSAEPKQLGGAVPVGVTNLKKLGASKPPVESPM